MVCVQQVYLFLVISKFISEFISLYIFNCFCLSIYNISISSSLYIHGFLIAYCTSLARSLALAVSLSISLTISLSASYHTCLFFLQSLPLSAVQTTTVCLSNCSSQCLSFKLPLYLFITICVSLSNYHWLSL